MAWILLHHHQLWAHSVWHTERRSARFYPWNNHRACQLGRRFYQYREKQQIVSSNFAQRRYKVIKKDYEYFSAHLEEYLKTHANEFAVVENEALIGFFPNQTAALVAMKDHELGHFLVKKVVPADQDFVEYHTQAIAFA